MHIKHCKLIEHLIQLLHRHPEAVKRPTFVQLHTSLQQPDNVLLEWSEDERAKYTENARTIGVMYQDGEMLHSTLQKTYVVSGTQK